MDQNAGQKWGMSWYDWLIFVLPSLVIVGLGLESAFGPPDGYKYRDLRAVAHWFDPILFQYNLVMTLLAALVVPTLVLSYIQTMTDRKERQLQREVPVERRAEIRRRMSRRASFSVYRGSVWLTTTIILLGVSLLLLSKTVSSPHGLGVDLSLGADMLTVGPFTELFEKNQDAYYTHVIRNLIAFQFGFLGAYIYFIGSVVRAYFTLDLTSHTFVDGAIRMIVASILALVLSFAFNFVALPADTTSPTTPVVARSKNSAESLHGASSSGTKASAGEKELTSGPDGMGGAEIPAIVNLLPVIAFFFGFYPKRALLAIERVALKAIQNIIPGDSYRALPLSILAGMSYTHELRLEREGFDNVENLSHADAVDLAVRTCFSYIQLKQWIGQAWLAARLREDYPSFVQRTGIESSEELRWFLCSCNSANIDGVGKLVTALSVDPATTSLWEMRLAALQLLLAMNTEPSQKPESLHTEEHKPIDIVFPNFTKP
jgi:hypothetical protein